jgi:hypothetical protein
MGLRNPKQNGVITIASFVQDDKIFYGVSYCSPTEKQYSRVFGTQLAKERMDANMAEGKSIPLSELKHGMIVLDILVDIMNQDDYPRWAYPLLVNNLLYPVGLQRFKKNTQPTFEIKGITVDSEESKKQLMLALAYIHDWADVDTNFVAVNTLIHLYKNPNLITVG